MSQKSTHDTIHRPNLTYRVVLKKDVVHHFTTFIFLLTKDRRQKFLVETISFQDPVSVDFR